MRTASTIRQNFGPSHDELDTQLDNQQNHGVDNSKLDWLDPQAWLSLTSSLLSQSRGAAALFLHRLHTSTMRLVRWLSSVNTIGGWSAKEMLFI